MKLVIHDFWNSPEYKTYEKPFYTLVFPIKDFLIATSLSMLYYHQGMKSKAKNALQRGS
jgi:hypothetical protein